MLKQSIINYFMVNFNVDVTKVSIVEHEFEDPSIRGEFVPEIPEVRVADLMEELTVVHELTHYCQLVHNASLCIASKIKDLKQYSEEEFEKEKQKYEDFQAEVEPEFRARFEATEDQFEKMLIQNEYNQIMNQFIYGMYSNRVIEIDARISMCAYFYEQNGYLTEELIDILFCDGYSDDVVKAIRNTRHSVREELLGILEEESGIDDPVEITYEFNFNLDE